MLALRDREALAQFGQRVAADDRRHQQAVRRERPADLHQRARQVVDGLHGEQRDGEVEAAASASGRRSRSPTAPAKSPAPRLARSARAGAPVRLAARGERAGGMRAGRSEVGGERKAALHQREAVDEFVRGADEQEIGARHAARAQARSSRRRTSARSKSSGGGAEEDTSRAICALLALSRKGAAALALASWTRVRPFSAKRPLRLSGSGGAGAVASRLGGRALDLLYPPTCLACRTATHAHGALCPRCWSAMRFIERPFCERLGTPFEQDLGDGLLSPQAMADPPAFGRARAVARFEDGPSRKLVHRLKYSDRGELARPIGALDGAGRRRSPHGRRPPRSRAAAPAVELWRRRFNQAAALARRDLPGDRRSLRAVRAPARQGDAQPGRPQPRPAGRERAGRLPRFR